VKKIILIGLLWLSVSEIALAKTRVVTSINVEKPGFLKLIANQDNQYDLWISSFSMFGGGKVQNISLTGDVFDLHESDVKLISEAIDWPNEITPIPEHIFGKGYFAVASGFLVPGRSTGSIYILDSNTGIVRAISEKKRGYFYHKVIWFDINGDGRLDIVSARAKKPIIGATDGELVWFEQPVNTDDIWREHLIAKGPDVNFLIEDLDGDGNIEILATEFFEKKLSIISRVGDTWEKRTLDDTLGSAFDIELVDINGDGKDDLLVTNHEGDEKAAVFAYEIPANLQKPWPRHTLIDGIVTENFGIKQASPGSAFAINIPKEDKKGLKPGIVFGGDGSTKVHYLKPLSSDTSDWSYSEEILVDTNSTIGTLAAGDLDGDGRAEIFAPAYDASRIYVISL
jgi:hypothetical protein